MKKIRLLIIDEHEAVRTALDMRLRSAPTIEVVAVAGNISEGEACMKAWPPDAVILGLKSSSNPGLDPTLKAVAALAAKRIPVIMLASYADDIQREMLLKAGARRYLLKDINTSQLIAEIAAASTEMTA